jgi:hypothetical protein
MGNLGSKETDMSTGEAAPDDALRRLPDVTVAGVAIDIDRIDDEHGTVWLYDRSGRRIAEVLDVARITIGTAWDVVCK